MLLGRMYLLVYSELINYTSSWIVLNKEVLKAVNNSVGVSTSWVIYEWLFFILMIM
jgi:hypothetical protein